MEKYVKLTELTGYDEEFLNALAELEQRIYESYGRFMKPRDGEVEHSMFTEFKQNFGYETRGKKYLKLVTGAFGEGQTSVWGFIAKQDFQVKNKKKSGGEFISFKEGDLLKSAGWRTPTLNAPRGNIFTEDYKIEWTGPNYL